MRHHRQAIGGHIRTRRANLLASVILRPNTITSGTWSDPGTAASINENVIRNNAGVTTDYAISDKDHGDDGTAQTYTLDWIDVPGTYSPHPGGMNFRQAAIKYALIWMYGSGNGTFSGAVGGVTIGGTAVSGVTFTPTPGAGNAWSQARLVPTVSGARNAWKFYNLFSNSGAAQPVLSIIANYGKSSGAFTLYTAYVEIFGDIL